MKLTLNEAANSNGVYSLMKGWLKVPVKDDIPADVDLEPDLSEWKDRLATLNTIEDIDNFIDDIYILRQSSILNDGEYGRGNLIFKELRNEGILQGLRDKKTELENQEMSLESLDEELKPVPKGTTIVELNKFIKQFKSLGLTESELDDLKESITNMPPAASLGADIYKFRWSPKSSHKGKSGSTRVIYILKLVSGLVYLALIYSKSDKDNIDPNELAGLKDLSKILNRR